MDKLNAIIQKIFKISKEEINDEISAKTISNWDSMNYLLFISEVEKEFVITFTMDEVLNAGQLGDIKNFMRQKGVILQEVL